MLLSLHDRVQIARLRFGGFTERFVDTDRGRVRALVATGTGSGPPVVVLHGIGAAAIHFHGVLPHLLRDSQRVIAPDLPGHGGSDVPHGGLTPESLESGLFSALDQLTEVPSVLAGNSMGGFAAIRYASRRPERVRGLVLISPGGAPGPAEHLTSVKQHFRMDARADAAAFVRRIHHRAPWYTPLIAGEVQRDFARPALQGFLDHISESHLLKPGDLARLTVPITLVWGQSERLLLDAHRDFFRAHLPAHAEIDTPPNFGHCPHLEVPREVADRITRLVRAV
jgi:pimeloyl-ACP methyl ester carboxylesterase